MEDQSIEDELLLILLSVLYLLVRLFSLLTPAGLSLDDRISFAIAMLELTRDLWEGKKRQKTGKRDSDVLLMTVKYSAI